MNRTSRGFKCSFLIGWTLILLVTTADTDEITETTQRDAYKSEEIGPHTQAVDLKDYQHIVYVSQEGSGVLKNILMFWRTRGTRQRPWGSVHSALKNVKDAREDNRYAVLVSAGTYKTINPTMKPYVDIFGGFDADEVGQN